MKTISLVKSLEQRFSAAGIDNAKRTAEELLAHLLDRKPLEIYLHEAPVSADRLQLLDEQAARITAGEPLQYVVGHVDFMGVKLHCDPRALIPRPETEQLVDEVLRSPMWQATTPVVVDVGTGSGCIVLALALAHSKAVLHAVDRSSDALDLARTNARLYGMEDRIQWQHGHLLDGFASASCDAIVANLPYIASAAWQALSPSVRDHEPKSALESGPSGMELIEELAARALEVLVPCGRLFLEFGFDQGPNVNELLQKLGYRDIRIMGDHSGHDRMASAVTPSC